MLRPLGLALIALSAVPSGAVAQGAAEPEVAPDPRARELVGRGLRELHAGSRAEALRAFESAERLDPGCVMCAWGIALALGPTLHEAMDSAGEVRAFRAMARAAAAAPSVAPRDQALIGALATRYAPVPGAVPRAVLDTAFASAMRAVADRFDEDPEVLVLHAAALMTLGRGDHAGRDAKTIRRRLGSALARDPNHPGACHLFIHAARPRDLDRALRCSARRPALSRLLTLTASLAGRGATAVAAARQASAELVYQTLVTFGRWDEVLAEPLPAPDDRFATGMAYYARGVAFAARGRWAEAGAALDSVGAAAGAVAEPRGRVLALAGRALAGEIALRRGNTSQAVLEFEGAVGLEDSLGVTEPLVWYYSMRQSLGKALLAAGRPEDAERVYREDLQRYPGNGWSLFGLAQALEGRGERGAAAEVRGQFGRAWADADVKPAGSRF